MRFCKKTLKTPGCLQPLSTALDICRWPLDRDLILKQTSPFEHLLLLTYYRAEISNPGIRPTLADRSVNVRGEASAYNVGIRMGSVPFWWTDDSLAAVSQYV